MHGVTKWRANWDEHIYDYTTAMRMTAIGDVEEPSLYVGDTDDSIPRSNDESVGVKLLTTAPTTDKCKLNF